MEVIFIKDLKNVGKKGEIKDFKDGYAQNFLIKKKYAIIKNDTNYKKLEIEKNKEKNIENENTEKAIKLKNILENKIFTFKVKTGEKDKVFGSISVKTIKEELNKEGYNINKNQIIIDNQISSLGFHEIEIVLYKDIKAKIKIELKK